jgi:hypothetical protein
MPADMALPTSEEASSPRCRTIPRLAEPADPPFIIDEFIFAKKRNRLVTMRTDHRAASHGSIVAPRSYCARRKGEPHSRE